MICAGRPSYACTKRGLIACDFFVTVTARFRLLYVFVVIEHDSRRLVHLNVTAHPTGGLDALQQLREAVGYQGLYKFLLHDRDSIFASHLDESIRKLGVQVLKSPPRCPKGNAICERVIGTIRRECLDWLIPLSESHLRSILKAWTTPLQWWTPAHGARTGRTRTLQRHRLKTWIGNHAMVYPRASRSACQTCRWMDCIMRYSAGAPDCVAEFLRTTMRLDDVVLRRRSGYCRCEESPLVTEAFLPLLPGALTVYAAVDWYRGKQWIALRKTGQAGLFSKINVHILRRCHAGDALVHLGKVAYNTIRLDFCRAAGRQRLTRVEQGAPRILRRRASTLSGERAFHALATWPAAVQALKLELYERAVRFILRRGETNVEFKEIKDRDHLRGID